MEKRSDAEVKASFVKDDSVDVDHDLAGTCPNVTQTASRSAKGYHARRYKVIQSQRVEKTDSTASSHQFDPKENFLRILPNRVKIVLPCGVIKSIAEKLQHVKDDTTPVDIFLFSTDIYPMTKTPDEAVFIKRPERKPCESAKTSSTLRPTENGTQSEDTESLKLPVLTNRRRIHNERSPHRDKSTEIASA
ncbi:hypothetical protein Tcan_12100 [Toxocara canis]|uniref:Uncharacterized protein n=2 Tax=Toxocara canis TaxID=6265 RepID=A0A0B2UPP4_TOXCA|nr:hypothetical protein Tcan_12100 [Toxocara canis]VDM40031.1 unnamed protein product [Toxocara canis]